MLTDDYTVRLDAFEGPLDLLLYLIRRAELDITEISIAQITDQFMKYLERVHELDVDAAAEFLVTAATLLEIKSRSVMPPEGAERRTAEGGKGDEQANPAAELVKQLLAYKQYRDAADALEARRDEWDRRYAAGRAGTDRAAIRAAQQSDDVELEELELIDLVEAFQRIIDTVQMDRLGDHQVTYDDTPIELHAEDVLDRLKRHVASSGEKRMNVRTVFEGRNRSEVIGLFLALLELARRSAIRVYQDRIHGDIVMALGDRPEAKMGEEDAEAMEASMGERHWDDDHIFDEEEIDADDDED